MALLDSCGCGLSTSLNDFFTYGEFVTTHDSSLSYANTSGMSVVANGTGPLGDPYIAAPQSSSVVDSILARNTPSITNAFIGMRLLSAGNTTANGLGRLYTTSIALMSSNGLTLGLVGILSNGAVALVGYPTTNAASFTSAAGAVPVNGSTWYYLEIGAVISGTSVALTVRVNGAAVITGTVSGNSSASSALGTVSVADFTGFTHYYLCDNTGSTNNTFLGDVRVQTLSPTANGTVNFTPSQPANADVMQALAPGGSSSSFGSGSLNLSRVSCTQSGTITSLEVGLAATFSGSAVLAIYADNGSGTAPAASSAPIGYGTLSGSTSGMQTVTISGSPACTAGSYYWVGYLSSVSLTLNTNAPGASTPFWSYGTAYASPPPSTPSSGGSASTNALWVGMVITPTATGTLVQQNAGVTTTAASSVSANNIYFRRVQAPAGVGGTINSLMYSLSAAITGNMMLAIYADNGSGTAPTGGPLGSGTVTNPTAGYVTVPLSPAVPYNNSAYYWIAVNASVSEAAFVMVGSVTTPAFSGTSTYSATAPAVTSVTSTSTGTSSGWVGFNYTPTTPTNWSIAADTPIATSFYNASSTQGATDLFAMSPVAGTTSTIFGVVGKTVAEKTDAGTRALANYIKSGSATSTGGGGSLPTSFAVIRDVFAVDPNTGVAWTPAGVNAAQMGYEVTT